MPNPVPLLLVLLSPQTATTDTDWEQTRRIAETQHEIVMLLIKNNEFDRVLEASTNIFSLNFPQHQEPLLVKEGQILADALSGRRQFLLAHRILDAALKAVASRKSKALLYKEKAYLCNKEGEDAKAMEFFEKALELERLSP